MLQMTDAMEAAVKQPGKGEERLLLMSGHDTTIMPLLVTLIGNGMDRWPPYLSNVVIELWEKKGSRGSEDGHFVRLFYNQEELHLEGAAPGANNHILFLDVIL